MAEHSDLIEARLRLTDSRLAKLSSDMAVFKRSLVELTVKVEALPRTLAEMLTERDQRDGYAERPRRPARMLPAPVA